MNYQECIVKSFYIFELSHICEISRLIAEVVKIFSSLHNFSFFMIVIVNNFQEYIREDFYNSAIYGLSGLVVKSIHNKRFMN